MSTVKTMRLMQRSSMAIARYSRYSSRCSIDESIPNRRSACPTRSLSDASDASDARAAPGRPGAAPARQPVTISSPGRDGADAAAGAV
ncbi:hypothetical protein, partial [Cellulosimicrobium cellulans]|uniref:hypothetical protein n=1 Tax=Cellulosimicrobium cellulans TaxID=1710 RepID=UPI001C0C4518